MKTQKLIITAEIENLPENANIADLQISYYQDFILTKINRGWKKVVFKPVQITNLEVKET